MKILKCLLILMLLISPIFAEDIPSANDNNILFLTDNDGNYWKIIPRAEDKTFRNITMGTLVVLTMWGISEHTSYGYASATGMLFILCTRFN